MKNTFLLNILLITGIALLSLTTLSASGKTPDYSGPPYPSENAINIVTTHTLHHEALDAAHVKGNGSDSGPPDPTAAPSPGDTRTDQWTACAPEGSPCTRHHRTDRWQHEDAPISGNDPGAGSGPYGWVPVAWGSSSCATHVLCLGAGTGSPAPK